MPFASAQDRVVRSAGMSPRDGDSFIAWGLLFVRRGDRYEWRRATDAERAAFAAAGSLA